MTDIGFIGLGNMGSPLARRLLLAGHVVTGHNRTRAKAEPMLGAGMRWAGTPREAAEAGTVVFTMVSDPKALDSVTLGPDGVFAGLRPGAIYLDLSTVDPRQSPPQAAAVSARQAQMVEAPVSGSPLTVERGEATFMAAGDAAAVDAARPLLLDIGRGVQYVGPLGLGRLLKLAVNLSVAGQMALLSEGLVLAMKAGITKEVALDVMLSSVIASPMLQYRAPFVKQMPERPFFTVAMMQKDLNLCLQSGQDLGAPLPTTAAVSQVLSLAAARGMAGLDFAAMFQALAEAAAGPAGPAS